MAKLKICYCGLWVTNYFFCQTNMKKLAASFCYRCIIAGLEIVAALAGLFVFASLIILWRLSAGPVPVDFARDYLQQSLSQPENDLHVTVEHIAVQWPETSSPVMLGLKDVRLVSGGSTDIFSVDEVGLILSLPSLIKGKIRPESIFMDKPSLRIIRTSDGLFKMSFQSGKAYEEDGIKIFADVMKSWTKGFEEQDFPSVLADLKLLEITSASLMVEDHSLGMTWFLPDAGFTLRRLENKAVVSTSIRIPGGLKTAQVEASLTYNIQRGLFSFDSDIQNFDPNFIARKFERFSAMGGHSFLINSKIKASLSRDLELVSASGHVSSSGGSLSLPELYRDSREFDSFFISAEYKSAGKKLTIPRADLVIEGIEIKASCQTELQGNNINLPLEIDIAQARVDAVGKLFPPKLKGTTAHKWLVRRMNGGKFKEVDIFADMEMSLEDFTASVKDIHADFIFEDVDVDYRSPLMPAEGSTGTGVFDYKENRLTINGKKARIGDLEAKDITLVFDDIMTAGGGVADIKARITGPFSTVLEYLARKPIEYGNELGIKPREVEGEADIEINVSFPTVKDLKKEEVKISAKGTVSNSLLPEMVSGLDLGGGPLDISVEEEYFEVVGDALLGGREVSFRWKQFFDSSGKPFSSQVKAEIGADKALREHFGVNLYDYLSGTVPLNLTYTSQINGSGAVEVTADLTPVILRFRPLEYKKLVGGEGEAGFKIVLQDGEPEEINNLEIKAGGLSLEKGRLVFGKVLGETDVVRARIGKFLMGRNNLGIEYERESGGLIKMAMSGAFLDARPFLAGRPEKEEKDSSYDSALQKDEPPMIISADAETMQTGEKEYVLNTKIYMVLDKAGDVTQLEMDAVAGKGDIYLRYKPDEVTGRREFHMEATDAGAALKAFGLYENVRGGKLTILGEPSGQAVRSGDLKGVARLNDFRVVEAPVLARLISAMSLQGIGQLLGNEGLVFAKLESHFDWFSRPEGALLVVSEGRTSGNSLGLTFEGVIDRKTNTIDLSGTIVPLSLINSMVGFIPLVGDLLAGGGAVFAATYTVKGDFKDPEVLVNPLAALAPGILRRILFEGG